MRKFRLVSISCFWLLVVVLHQAQAQTSDPNRIPPLYADEWFYDRIIWLSLFGAFFGFVEAAIWLPKRLSTPHGDDIRRGLKHFWRALGVAFLSSVAIVLIDILYVHRFGNRTHSFWDTLIQVGLSWQTFALLGLSAVSCLTVVAIWTRWISFNCYRYMLIRR
jgi:hypothetical protein